MTSPEEAPQVGDQGRAWLEMVDRSQAADIPVPWHPDPNGDPERIITTSLAVYLETADHGVGSPGLVLARIAGLAVNDPMRAVGIARMQAEIDKRLAKEETHA